MKCFFLTILTLSSFSIYAELTLKNDKELNDLMYFPEAKKIFGRTALEMSFNKNVIYASGSLYQKEEDDNGVLSQTIGYTYSDRLMFTLNISELLFSDQKMTFGPSYSSPNTSTSLKDDGLMDPTVAVKFRAMSQEVLPLNVDVFLKFSPSLGDKKGSTEASSVVSKGNGYRGGLLVSAGGEIGRKYTATSWKFGLSADLVGKTTTNYSGNYTETSKAQTNFSANFSGQWVINSSIITNFHTGFSIEGKEEISLGSTYLYNSDTKKTILYGADFIFTITNKMALELDFLGKSRSDADAKRTTVASGAVISGQTQSKADGVVSIATKYEF